MQVGWNVCSSTSRMPFSMSDAAKKKSSNVKTLTILMNVSLGWRKFMKDITHDFREIENTVIQLIESRCSNVNVANAEPKQSTDEALQNPLNPTTET